MNRLTVKNRPGDPNITFLYDIAGRIYDVNDAGDITEYYYDRLGRISDVNDHEDRLVSYEYDDRGLRTKLIYPDDSYITYEYDALSRLTKIIDDSNSILAQYQYDELSRRTLVTLGNDANAVYEYDLGNRLTKLTNNIDDTNSITFEYSNYDKVGNRLSMKIDDSNAYVFTYDNLYQLTFVDYNDSNSTSYSYDSLGNRTDVNDGTPTTYLRNNLNQYTSVGSTNYSYDNNGNLTDDGLFKYYYDCENRLTDVNNQSDTAVASYSYDYLGRRISKTVYGSPDVTTKYCYDGDQVIAEYDGSDILLRKFVYGPGIDEPICMIDVDGGNVVYYYHFDGLGSVAALSDVNNVVVERYSYDVFGAPTIYNANGSEIPQSVNGNPYMFTARRADDETALYYYRARYYAFDIGRFLQADPIGYVDGLNLYTYCGNNPTNWTDSWGLLHYNKRDTQAIIDKGKNSIYQPWRHALGAPFETYGWDFQNMSTYANATFELQDGTIMNAAEFGNYYAGYMGTYHGGDVGYIGMRVFGNWYENAKKYDKWYDIRKYNPFWGDCNESIRDLQRGNLDGQRAKYKDYKSTLDAVKDIAKDYYGKLKGVFKRKKCK